MSVYKFNAESLDDVVELLHRIVVESFEVTSKHPPDVMVTIAHPTLEGRPLSLDRLREIATDMANGHTVRETLARADR
jgi:hypothetical protein